MQFCIYCKKNLCHPCRDVGMNDRQPACPPHSICGQRSSISLILFSIRTLPARFRKSIPVRSGLVQQIAYEEIQQSALSVTAPCAMAATGHKEEVEVLAGLDQAVDDLQRGRGIDVLVHLSHDQQQLALKAPGVVHV